MPTHDPSPHRPRSAAATCLRPACGVLARQRRCRRPSVPLAAAGAAAVLGLAVPSLATDRWFVGTPSGQWFDSAAWARSPGGPGGAGVPEADVVAHLAAGRGTAFTCLLDGGTTPILRAVRLEGLGTADLQIGNGTLRTGSLLAGIDGGGDVHAGPDAILQAARVVLGVLPSGASTLVLDGGTLDVGTFTAGSAGSGTLQQLGGTIGTNEVRLGAVAGGSGFLSQEGGDLQTAQLLIGDRGEGLLVQDDGTIVVGSASIAATGTAEGLASLLGGSMDVVGDLEVGTGGAGRVVVDGGALSAGSLLIGAGTFEAEGLVELLSGSIDVAGTVRLEKEFLIGTAELDVRGGVFSGGTVEVADGGRVHQQAGEMSVDAFVVEDDLVLDGGITEAGSVVLGPGPGAFLQLNTGGDLRVPLLVAAADGTIRIDDGRISGGAAETPGGDPVRGRIETASRLQIGGTELFVDVILEPVAGPSTFEERFELLSPLVRIRGGLEVQRSIRISEDRLLEVEGSPGDFGMRVVLGGVVRVNGTLSNLGQPLVSEPGSVVSGRGAILGGATVGGALRVDQEESIETMTVSGGLELLPTAALQVDVAGAGPEPGQADRLEMFALASNPVTLGGRLQFRLLAGYDPQPGDVVRVMSWNEASPVDGSFGEVVAAEGTPLPDGLAAIAIVTSTGVDLAFVRDEDRCPADVDGDGEVTFGDVLAVVSAFGATGGPADVDGDGVVAFGDVLAVVSAFGACP